MEDVNTDEIKEGADKVKEGQTEAKEGMEQIEQAQPTESGSGGLFS